MIQAADILTSTSRDRRSISYHVCGVGLGPGGLHNWWKLHSISVAISSSSKISVGLAIVEKLIKA